MMAPQFATAAPIPFPVTEHADAASRGHVEQKFPVLALRPYNGGMRRFAVEKLQPVVAPPQVHVDAATACAMRVWRRAEERGYVAVLIIDELRRRHYSGRQGEDPRCYIGTGNSAESAVREAWEIGVDAGDQRMEGGDPWLVVIRPARDFDAHEMQPPVE